MTITAYKKSRCIRFVCVVEAYFLEPTRLIIVAYNNVKSMFLAVVGAKIQSYKGVTKEIFCTNCTLT